MQDYTYRDFDIIDAHTHIFPARLAAKAADSIGAFYGLPARHTAAPEELLASGGEFGVKKYLVCSVATAPRQVRDINNFIAAQCAEHPEFFGFGTIHPLMEGAEEEIDRIVAMGLHGIKLHPDFQQFNLDSPEAFRVFDAAQGRLPFLIHMGDDRYDFSSPERLERALDNFPRLKVTAAHFGGYHQWEEAERVLCRDRVAVDTSSSLPFLDKSYVKHLIGRYGVDNCFFGTDFPLWRYGDEVKSFLELGLPFEDMKKLLADNFRAHFGAG